VKKEEARQEKIEGATHNEVGPIQGIKILKLEELQGRTLVNAKPLKEFKQMDWIPIKFEEIFNQRRPYSNQKESTRAIEFNFPKERHSGYELDKESAGEIIQRLFNEEEEVDPDHIAEVKRIMGLKPEASPYAHLAEVYAIGADHVEGTSLPTPHISCNINAKKICKALCDIVAHVSVMTSKICYELFSKTLNLAPTQIKLIIGDGRTTRPLGVLRDLDVAISGKTIPTDFFTTDACHNEHDDIILGRPFLKLVNAVLDSRKGRVTIDLVGTKSTYDFLPASRIALPLPLDNEEVGDFCFFDTFKDPLQRVMKNDAMYDDQDKKLAEAIEGLKAQDKSLDEENYEDIGDLKQQEHEMPNIELKPLPKGLSYEFLGDNKMYPVIVSDELSPEKMDKLLNLLRKH
jgi:hypothetical protein